MGEHAAVSIGKKQAEGEQHRINMRYRAYGGKHGHHRRNISATRGEAIANHHADEKNQHQHAVAALQLAAAEHIGKHARHPFEEIGFGERGRQTDNAAIPNQGVPAAFVLQNVIPINHAHNNAAHHRRQRHRRRINAGKVAGNPAQKGADENRQQPFFAAFHRPHFLQAFHGDFFPIHFGHFRLIHQIKHQRREESHQQAGHGSGEKPLHPAHFHMQNRQNQAERQRIGCHGGEKNIAGVFHGEISVEQQKKAAALGAFFRIRADGAGHAVHNRHHNAAAARRDRGHARGNQQIKNGVDVAQAQCGAAEAAYHQISNAPPEAGHHKSGAQRKSGKHEPSGGGGIAGEHVFHVQPLLVGREAHGNRRAGYRREQHHRHRPRLGHQTENGGNIPAEQPPSHQR